MLLQMPPVESFGLSGWYESSTIINCVSASVLNNKTLLDVIGELYEGSVVSNYESMSQDNLKKCTNEELQSKLGNEFIRDENNINNGFPILKWQVGQ